MQVAALVSRPAVTIASHASFRDAVDAMHAHQVGALVIVEPRLRDYEPTEVPIGIVSERDVVTALAEGVGLDDDLLDLPRQEPYQVHSDDSVVVAASSMRDKGVRHLLVVEDGRPVGVLSVRDLIGALLRERTESRRLVLDAIRPLFETDEIGPEDGESAVEGA